MSQLASAASTHNAVGSDEARQPHAVDLVLVEYDRRVAHALGQVSAPRTVSASSPVLLLAHSRGKVEGAHQRLRHGADEADTQALGEAESTAALRAFDRLERNARQARCQAVAHVERQQRTLSSSR